jgi:hypothetical protein
MRKRTTILKTIFVLASCVVSVFAQATPNPLTDAVMSRYKTIRQNLVEAAQTMPEEHYAFRLTPAQRPFGEWIGHVAMGNMFYCATVKGEAAPDTSHVHQLTSKSDLVEAIQKSFDYCDEALKGMTDQKALGEVTVGGKKVYPVQGMIGVVASGNEHYGNLVGYLRSKGITPPSSARKK